MQEHARHFREGIDAGCWDCTEAAIYVQGEVQLLYVC